MVYSNTEAHLLATGAMDRLIHRFVADVKSSTGNVVALEQAKEVNKQIYQVLFIATGLGHAQAMMFLPALDSYISHPDERHWSYVRDLARRFLEVVESLLDLLQNSPGNYILEPEYRAVLRSSISRHATLSSIIERTTPPPVEMVRPLREAYGRLVVALESSASELSEYVKQREAREKNMQAEHAAKARILENGYRVTQSQHGVVRAIATLAVIAGVVFSGMGVWLTILGADSARSEVELLGQSIKTGSVGVAAIFFGAITVIFGVRRVLATMDKTIQNRNGG